MKEIVNAGNLLPDSLILRVIREHFLKVRRCCAVLHVCTHGREWQGDNTIPACSLHGTERAAGCLRLSGSTAAAGGTAGGGSTMGRSPLHAPLRPPVAQAHAEGVDRFLLDGFPRTADQAAALDAIADVKLAVNLGLREEVRPLALAFCTIMKSRHGLAAPALGSGRPRVAGPSGGAEAESGAPHGPAGTGGEVPGAPHLQEVRQELQHCRHLPARLARRPPRDRDAAAQPAARVHGGLADAALAVRGGMRRAPQCVACLG